MVLTLRKPPTEATVAGWQHAPPLLSKAVLNWKKKLRPSAYNAKPTRKMVQKGPCFDQNRWILGGGEVNSGVLTPSSLHPTRQHGRFFGCLIFDSGDRTEPQPSLKSQPKGTGPSETKWLVPPCVIALACAKTSIVAPQHPSPEGNTASKPERRPARGEPGRAMDGLIEGM